MGLIQDLSHHQEEFRGLVRDLYQDGGIGDLDEDNIVAVCMTFAEMRNDGEDRTPDGNDVITAIEFLDHLDTLGKEIRPKHENA